MKKVTFLLFTVLLCISGSTVPAINQGYIELDKLFGFVAIPGENECRLSRDRSKTFARGKNNCCWQKTFHILDSYHIDPNTYFFKTPERETLLDCAACQGNIKAMKQLISTYKMNITDNALIAAIKNNKRRALKFFLNNGGKPTAYVLDYARDAHTQWAVHVFSHYGFRR